MVSDVGISSAKQRVWTTFPVFTLCFGVNPNDSQHKCLKKPPEDENKAMLQSKPEYKSDKYDIRLRF